MTHEWRYTYRSARRDGWSRRAAFRKYLREEAYGVLLRSGLHPHYDRMGRPR